MSSTENHHKGKSKKNRIYNVKIQHVDKNEDEMLKLTFNKSLPSSIDLSTSMDIIYDQGILGSCTANALSWAFKYRARDINPSRLFIYYNERMLDQREGDNSVTIDDGSTLKQGVNTLRRFGVCGENLLPYIPRKFAQKPSPVCYNQGLKNKIRNYSFLPQNIEAMKNCLNQGYPFVFGILVFSSFEDDVVDHTGVVPYPDISKESLLGGHALVAVGYDDATQRIKFANSWGRSWGNRGYGYIPYSYITNTSLTDDLWIIYNVTRRNRLRKNKKRKMGGGKRRGGKLKLSKNDRPHFHKNSFKRTPVSDIVNKEFHFKMDYEYGLSKREKMKLWRKKYKIRIVHKR